MWDMTGLESLFNVTAIMQQHADWEKENVWRILQEKTLAKQPPHVPLEVLILRARYNNQRHYEIYMFESEFTEVDIKQMFESSPQLMADTIRRVGHEFYSDRIATKTQVIT
jgi:hypothetical protein